MYFSFSFLVLFCNQSALFAQRENVNKLWNNNCTLHVNYQNQNKKSCLIQIKHLFHCSIYPTNNAMVSLKVGFTVWRQSLKEEFSSIINYINVWLSLMTCHGANPIFFNKKNKDWMSRTPLTPHPLRPITSYFCLTPFLPLPPK